MSDEQPPYDFGDLSEEHADPVEVLETGDEAKIMIATSMLRGADILFRADGENLQDLYGAGRLGSGYNQLVGRVRLLVEADRAMEARELLADLIADAEREDREGTLEEGPSEAE